MPTVKELQQQARQKGIPYSGLRKAELMDILGMAGLVQPVKAIKNIQKVEKKQYVKPIPVVLPPPPKPLWLSTKTASADEKKKMLGTQRTAEFITDAVGKEIFDVFVKKYTADKVFERANTKILDMYNKQRLLTTIDRDYLLNIIEQFNEIYDKFVARVNKERRFVEKSGSGNAPRNIVTGSDWAEAIIELQDIINKFLQAFDANIKSRTDPKKLTEYCEKSDLATCAYPCKKKISKIGKDKCIY
jgi:hypothetical protein